MKKQALYIVAALSLAACNSPKGADNQTEKSKSQTKAVWDKSYGGADKAYDSELLALRDEVAPKFQTLKFKDEETGRTMTYSLFIPKNYDKSKKYPLVQFIADASSVGKGAASPLKQGYGGIIWATDESQAEHPCFVLVPAFDGPESGVNDQWQTTEEVGVSYRLLNDVVARYRIDKGRIYTTGQSMGGMISFYLNATHPDFFAASIFVGSQWDIKVLQPLTKAKFFYITAAGDEKASGGMREVKALLDKNGVKYGATEFSAKLPQQEQEQKVADMLKQGHDANFVQFTKGSVLPPEGTEIKGAPEHMYSFDYAYRLKTVRDWLFTQKKN